MLTNFTLEEVVNYWLNIRAVINDTISEKSKSSFLILLLIAYSLFSWKHLH